MRFPVNTFTRVLSRFIKIPVNKNRTSDDKPLYVDLVNGRLRLSTDRAVYSFEDKYDNFYQAFKLPELRSLNGKKVLMLGGGLGSVAYILEKIHSVKPHMIIIEKEIEIIKLFNLYTKPFLNSHIEIYCQDAIQYLNGCQDNFDLIVVDLFIDDIIPDQFKTINFLNLCQSRLNPEGKLLYNWLILSKHQSKISELFQYEIFSKVFEDTHVVKTRYNKIFVGSQN